MKIYSSEDFEISFSNHTGLNNFHFKINVILLKNLNTYQHRKVIDLLYKYFDTTTVHDFIGMRGETKKLYKSSYKFVNELSTLNLHKVFQNLVRGGFLFIFME